MKCSPTRALHYTFGHLAQFWILRMLLKDLPPMYETVRPHINYFSWKSIYIALTEKVTHMQIKAIRSSRNGRYNSSPYQTSHHSKKILTADKCRYLQKTRNHYYKSTFLNIPSMLDFETRKRKLKTISQTVQTFDAEITVEPVLSPFITLNLRVGTDTTVFGHAMPKTFLADLDVEFRNNESKIDFNSI